MTTPLRATLDPNAAGAGLFVAEGNLTAQTILNLAAQASIHGTVPAFSGDFSAEFYFWSTSRNSLAGKVRVGIAQPSSPLNQAVGADSLSYGWDPAAGIVYRSGVQVGAAVPVQDERVTLGLYLFLSAGVATLSFVVNGTAQWTGAVAVGVPWVFAVSLSGDAGDIQFASNFGQYLFDAPVSRAGWVQLAPGLATLYLSLAREAFLSDVGDSPANQTFVPRIINAEQFSVKRAPVAWPHRSGNVAGAALPSAYSALELDNSRGEFSALLRADARDAQVVIQALAAPSAPAGGTGSLAGATVLFTANVDQVSQPSANTISVTLKDTIARLDAALLMHLVPLYAEEGSAGKAVPLGMGAQRNFTPLVFSSSDRLFLMGDLQFTNVAQCSDKGAPLDPLTQYAPAMSGRAVQLAVLPEGKLTIDASTVGSQAPLPGVLDVLGGIGAFTTWTAGVPAGWQKPTNPPFPAGVVSGGSITQTSAYGTTSAMLIQSTVVHRPSAGLWFGYPIQSVANYFQPGRTYRVSFKLLSAVGPWGPTYHWGLALLTAYTDDRRYWITDYLSGINVPLGTPGNAGTYYYEFTVPLTVSTVQPLIITLIADMQAGVTAPTSFTVGVVIDDLKIELLGQFVTQPLSSFRLQDAIAEILVNHQGEPASIFSSADLAAIATSSALGNGVEYILGARWTEPPNVMDAVQELLDNHCGVMFTDAANNIRFRRLSDPALGTPVALFNTSNINLEDPSNFSVLPDDAQGLTTLAGFRRNWDPFGDGDYVSDNATVTPSMRQAYKQTSQFQVASKVQLASEYTHAVNAPRKHFLHDDREQGAYEHDRVLSIWQAQFDAVSLSATKRVIVRLTVNFDDLMIGAGPQVAVHQLYYNDVVLIDVPERGFSMAPGAVLSTELFPFARKMVLEVLV